MRSAAVTDHHLEPRPAWVSPPRPSRSASRLGLLSFAIALVPIAAAAVRALHAGWLPVGDNALLVIRSRDVFSEHIPLLGTWTSASLSLGTDLNNPGPLLFDLLAMPTRFAGLGGAVVGVALLQAAAVVGLAVFAHRRGGPLLTALVMAVTAALCWSIGSEVLVEPWQPHSLLVPFLWFLVLVWCCTCGDLLALPWAVGVGSLLVQTHLSYGFLVPVLGAWAVAGCALELRRARTAQTRSWPGLRRRALRTAAVAGIVLAVCWAQPLVEQLTGDGQGNLARLTEAVSDPPDTIGLAKATRVVATVAAIPPWWLRPSFSHAWYETPIRDGIGGGDDLPSLPLAVGGLAALALVLTGCAWDARRRRDPVSTRVIGTAALVLVLGVYTAGRVPVSMFGLAAHQFRWVWPAAAFITLALATTLARALAERRVRVVTLSRVAVLATAVVAGLNLPVSDQGTSAVTTAMGPARELGRQMDGIEGQGPLLIDGLFRSFGDPYGAAVLAELQRRDVEFVAGGSLARQLGPRRRFTGSNARAELLMRTGDAAHDPPSGARLVAIHEGLTRAERQELAAAQSVVADHVRRSGLRLDDRGRKAQARGGFTTLRLVPGQAIDTEAAFTSRELAVALRWDYVVLDDDAGATFARYAELQRRADEETVGLYLAPLARG